VVWLGFRSGSINTEYPKYWGPSEVTKINRKTCEQGKAFEPKIPLKNEGKYRGIFRVFLKHS